MRGVRWLIETGNLVSSPAVYYGISRVVDRLFVLVDLERE